VSPLRVAYLVFPRRDPLFPVLTFVWDAIEALCTLGQVELEVLIPLPLLRRGTWPKDIEQRLSALSPPPVLVPYLPLKNRSIEAAAGAIALKLLRRPRDRRPHLIQGSLLDEAGYAAVKAAEVLGCRSIAVAHGSDVRAALGELADVGRQRRAQAAIGGATRLLAVSKHLVAELAACGGRAELLRYGVSAADFPLAPFEAPKNVVLFVGRISRDKGVQVLLEAVALLPGVKLRLAGARVDIDVEAEALRLGIAERVEVLGEVPHHELQPLYAGASVTVLPSLYEGFGIVLVESLLVGRPVVGSATGGIREIVRERELAAPNNPQDLARVLRRVLDAPETPENLRSRAMPFTWEHNAPLLLSRMYEALA
jgi:glycosyltransferase involved in cell wall biosynthesis